MWQPFHDDPEYYEDRARGLDGSVDREVIAARHGCDSWEALVARLGRLDREPFARAYRALEAHDADALRAELEAHPEIARQEGTNGNDLLAMATATGDERTVELLLAAGADPSHGNAHGWTPLHQTAYSGQLGLAERLLDAGADLGACGRGDGGTPLIVALWEGNAGLAEVFAARGGVRPRNLRAAAGLGDGALVAELLGTPEAGAHRGFYRPHGGFPEWTASDDPQEVLDEALSFAARNDRVDAVRQLVDAGAGLEADVYRGTPLMWAAAFGKTAAMRALLALGADVDGRSSFGGASHGKDVTPLHIAGQFGEAAAVEVLLDAGADTTIVDGHGYGTPAGWTEHGGHPELAARIRARVA